MRKNAPRLKPYTLTGLANLYDVSTSTLKNWLKKFEEELGEKEGNYFNVRQVEIIFRELGIPGYVRTD